jgi:cytochrome c oxidase subunit 1
MVFFVLTAALSGTFNNLLIPLQIGAKIWPLVFYEYDFILAVLCCGTSLFAEAGPRFRLDHISSP